QLMYSDAFLAQYRVRLIQVTRGVMEVHPARDFVLDGRLHGHPELAQPPMDGLQLLKASELPRRVVQARLGRLGRLARGELEEGEVVVLAAEAEEDGAVLQVLVGELEAERARVELLGFLGIANLQHDVAKLAGSNHRCAPALRGACTWSGGIAPSSPAS